MRLWTDHGQSPKNDTYGYTVYLGKDEPARKLPFEVLRNDTLIQAVRSTDKKVVEAVFYPEEDFYLDENGDPVFYLLENTVALPEAGILLVPISLETLLDEL